MKEKITCEMVVKSIIGLINEHRGKATKIVEISMASPDDGIGSHRDAVAMTRKEFLKACGEFYDNRGTHCDDFEVMQVKISVEGAR